MILKKKMNSLKIIIFLMLITIVKTEQTADTGADKDNSPSKDAETKTETTETQNETPKEKADDSPEGKGEDDDDDDAEAPPTELGKKCNLSIIKELGMQGLETSKKIKLVMCGDMEESCCEIKDQVEFYNHWITKKEESNLNQRFAYHEEIYMKFLSEIKSVYGRAVDMLEDLPHNDMTECRIIARRIVHYQLPNIIPVLEELLKDMHSFYKETYKGVFCSVCDADSNVFIQDNEIDFSKKFCRDIIKNSLGVLLYFHTHVPRLVNLMSKFLVSCDNEGEFESKPVPTEVYFNVNVELSQNLLGCKEFRNKPDWFDSCGKICENFSLFEFNKFFQPNLEQFGTYETFVKDSIKNMDEKSKKKKEAAENANKPEGEKKEGDDDSDSEEKSEKKTKLTNKKKARILEEEVSDDDDEESKDENKEGEKKEEVKEAEKKEEETKKDDLPPAEKFKSLLIYEIKEDSPLIKIKSNFKEEGVLLFDQGEDTEINEETLEKAKNGEQPPEPEPPKVEVVIAEPEKEEEKQEEKQEEESALRYYGFEIIFLVFCFI